MYTSDKNIMHLIDLLIFQKRISSIRDFCIEVEMFEQSITKIKKGTSHFTVIQIEKICKIYHVNANWVFGIENQIFTKIKSNQKSVQNSTFQEI